MNEDQTMNHEALSQGEIVPVIQPVTKIKRVDHEAIAAETDPSHPLNLYYSLAAGTTGDN